MRSWKILVLKSSRAGFVEATTQVDDFHSKRAAAEDIGIAMMPRGSYGFGSEGKRL